MSTRTIRRAAERQALKAARKQSLAEAPPAVSQAQLTANRANAQLSPGPITPEGKAISARNHTTHGLTCDTAGPFRVLPGEDQAAYDESLAGFTAEFNPVTETERDLVERLATHRWLRRRALRLQNELLEHGNGLSDPRDFKEFQLYDRYSAAHQRAFSKALAEIMRLRTFQMRQKKDEALLQRNAELTAVRIQIRFESQKMKAEAHAVKMEIAHLRQEALKQRTQRFQKPQTAAPAAEITLESAA